MLMRATIFKPARQVYLLINKTGYTTDLIKKINTLKKKHNAVILAHNYQLPDEHAGYPMAEMITARQLMELKRKHPNAKIICYVNTTAEVKALCHICCTSANAVDMINGPLKNEKEIIFY